MRLLETQLGYIAFTHTHALYKANGKSSPRSSVAYVPDLPWTFPDLAPPPTTMCSSSSSRLPGSSSTWRNIFEAACTSQNNAVHWPTLVMHPRCQLHLSWVMTDTPAMTLSVFDVSLSLLIPSMSWTFLPIPSHFYCWLSTLSFREDKWLSHNDISNIRQLCTTTPF